MTRIPAEWSLSTTHLGGTPTADTKRVVFSYTYQTKSWVFSGLWHEAHAWRTSWTHLDDNVDQLGQLTLLVVVLNIVYNTRYISRPASFQLRWASLALVGAVILSKGTYVGLPGVSSDLRQQQVDAERGVLIVQSVLDDANLKNRRCGQVHGALAENG